MRDRLAGHHPQGRRRGRQGHQRGSIRNHDQSDLFWDADKVADVLIECAELDADADDFARGLLAAQSALAFADSVAHHETVRARFPALAQIVADGETNLRSSIAMLHSRLYPDYPNHSG